MQPINVKLNPLCRLQLREPLNLDVLLDDISVELPDRRYVSLLADFGTATSYQSASEHAGRALGVDTHHGEHIVKDLIKHKVLVDADQPRTQQEERLALWIKRGWMEGLVFHFETRNLHYDDADGKTDDVASNLPAVEFWKEYPGAPIIALPAATAPRMTEPLAESMVRRRCNRAYREKTRSMGELSTLLHYGNMSVLRARQEAERAYNERSSTFLRHSAWAPIETYVLAFAVVGLEPGLYHYDLRHHHLTLIKTGIDRREIAACYLGQKLATDAPCTFLFTSVWERFMARYQHARGYRNLLVNTSELGQRYLLIATALGMSTWMSPQSLFRKTQPLLGLRHFEEGLVYSVSVG